MIRVFGLSIALLAVTCASAPKLNADIVLTITDNGSDGSFFHFLGTGTTANSGFYIGYGTPTDTFLPNGTSVFSDSSESPDLALGSAGVNQSYVRDRNNDLSLGIHSFVEFIFDSTVPASTSLSGLNGTYEMDTIPFSTFVPGTYDLQQISFGGSINAGDYRLIVAVPEPSSFVLAVLAAFFAIGFRHRKDLIAGEV
ncbi:MAG: PEP-CTERM sorting domain-containing protein [Planctomycetota bacterium]